jgi:hypothetical protein
MGLCLIAVRLLALLGIPNLRSQIPALLFEICDLKRAERLAPPASPINRYEVAHLLRNPG